MFRLGNIGAKWMNAGALQFLGGHGAAAQSKDFVPLPDQFDAQGQANVTGADDENTHERTIRNRRQKMKRI